MFGLGQVLSVNFPLQAAEPDLTHNGPWGSHAFPLVALVDTYSKGLCPMHLILTTRVDATHTSTTTPLSTVMCLTYLSTPNNHPCPRYSLLKTYTVLGHLFPSCFPDSKGHLLHLDAMSNHIRLWEIFWLKCSSNCSFLVINLNSDI